MGSPTSSSPAGLEPATRGVEALCSSAELRGDRRPWNRTTLDRRIRAAPAQPARRRISPGGFEPPSPTSAKWCSDPLSYGESSASNMMTTRWLGAIGECDARTQGASICAHIGATEDEAARPPSAPRRPVLHRVGSSTSALDGSRTRLTRETAEPHHQARPRASHGAPGNRTPLGWVQTTILTTKSPAKSDRRDSNPVRSAGDAVCFRPDTTVAWGNAPSGARTRVTGVRDRHPVRLDDRGMRSTDGRNRTLCVGFGDRVDAMSSSAGRCIKLPGRDSNHASFGSEPKILPLDDRGTSCDGWGRTSVVRVTAGRPAIGRRRIEIPPRGFEPRTSRV